jgi:Tesmin/TSO1-like CXC domain, cysteine-rich domain
MFTFSKQKMKDYSIDTTNSSTVTSAPASDLSGRKRGSEGNTKCKCSKSGCTTKVCSCRKLGGLCTDACGCIGCQNRASTESESENDRPADATFKIPVLKESNSDNEHFLNGTFTVTETPERLDTDSENVTPKRAK